MGVVSSGCGFGCKTEEFDRIAYFVQEYMMMMMTTDNLMAYYEWKKVYKSKEMRSLQLFTFIVQHSDKAGNFHFK